MANYEYDMHCHTTRSDGRDTPLELIQNACTAGLRGVAMTDHDVLPPTLIQTESGMMTPTQFAKSLGLSLFVGVEFSCETLIEDVHLLAFGCDWSSSALHAICDDIKKSKAASYIELLEKLSAHGMPFTLSNVLPKGDTPDMLQKKHIFNAMATHGYFPDWKAAKLAVKNNKALHVERKKPLVKHVIASIHRAGGIAVLAHPFLIDQTVHHGDEQMSRWAFIDRMISYGLDGIETCYPYDKTTCTEALSNEEMWCQVKEQYQGRLFFSGGSDYHNDMKSGSKAPRCLGECGLTHDAFIQTPLYERLAYSNLTND